MRTALRWIVVALGVTHGLIHLFGAAKGLAAIPLSWAELMIGVGGPSG